MESNAIEIRGLCKRYKGFSLDDLNLDLPYGCVLGLVGENGAGKSTTIRLIMDALERDGGTVSVLGADNQSKEFLDLKEDIGVVLDETAAKSANTSSSSSRTMGSSPPVASSRSRSLGRWLRAAAMPSFMVMPRE